MRDRFHSRYRVAPGALSRRGRRGRVTRVPCDKRERSQGPRQRAGHSLQPRSDGVFSSRPSPPRLRPTSFSSGQTQSSSPHPFVTCLLQPMCECVISSPSSPHPPAAPGCHRLMPTASHALFSMIAQSPTSLSFLHYTLLKPRFIFCLGVG